MKYDADTGPLFGKWDWLYAAIVFGCVAYTATSLAGGIVYVIWRLL